MRWAIFVTAALSFMLAVAAVLFMFVSHAERESRITCEAFGDVPYEADGRFVGSSTDLAFICREQVTYWWQGED